MYISNASKILETEIFFEIFLVISTVLVTLKMSVENPNDLLSPETYFPFYFEDLLQMRTQKEKQLRHSIKKIIIVLLQFDELNTSQIKSKTGLYANSVNRVLKLFIEKDLVHLRTHEDRRNNEKLYTLKRDRAIFYYRNLIMYKIPIKNIVKGAYRRKKEEEARGELDEYRYYPYWYFHFFKDTQRKLKLNNQLLKVTDVPIDLREKILIQRGNGNYCLDCMENTGTITELRRIDDKIVVCSQCGKESQLIEELPKKQTTKSRVWEVDKEIHKTINKQKKKSN